MLQNIPAELRSLNQWVSAGADKIPLNPRTGQLASVIDPSTWGTFDDAVRSGRKHVGFVLTSYDEYCIIDLDNKPEKPLSEQEWGVHERILKSFDSYIEKSASGRGYHIVIKGRMEQGRRRGNVEAYCAERYMIFTGDVVRNSPIKNCQETLDILLAEMTPATKFSELTQVDGDLLDSELVERAMYAANGDKFTRLCNGEFADYPSQSEADFALMSIIAFYTKDNEQVRRIFRMTALGKRDKALRDSYLNYALSKIRANEPVPVDLEAIKRAAEAVAAPKVEPAMVVPPPPRSEAVAPKAKAAEPIPTRLDMPPGLVGEVAQYFYSAAIRPVHEIALAAALAVTAGVCGRAFNISGTGLNQYIILLARTGSGKEGAMSGIENLMAAVRPQVPMVDQFLGPAAFSSGQALVKVLNDKPCFVSVLGEFGLTLQDISDTRAPAPQRMLKKVLLDLYAKSGFNSVLRSSVYSDVEKNTKIVQAPNVTILGESTPETFFDKLDGSHIAEGLIPRFSIIQYEGPRPARNRNANCAPSAELVQRFSELVAVSLTMSHKQACSPVQIESDALAVLDAFDAEADRMMNSTKQDAEIQLWNRAHLKALKLSALIAVGVNPHQPAITTEIAEWAVQFTSMDIHVIADKFRDGDVGQGETKQMADLKRVVQHYYQIDPNAPPKGVNAALLKAGIIPASWLSTRTASMASFRHDRLGSNAALKRNLEIMIEAGRLVKITPMHLQSGFKYSGVAYGLGTEWQ